jgi:hypothetical protein
LPHPRPERAIYRTPPFGPTNCDEPAAPPSLLNRDAARRPRVAASEPIHLLKRPGRHRARRRPPTRAWVAAVRQLGRPHFLRVGNRRWEWQNLFLPVGSWARIFLTTCLAFALALEGKDAAGLSS